MARTTISLPDDLKAEIDKMGGDSNWSALAADAFRTELNRIKARNTALKGKPMQAAVQRLKASKEAYVRDAEARGNSAGIVWARDTAEYGELKALSDNLPPEWSFGPLNGDGAPAAFLRMIGADANRSAVDDFWSSLGFENTDLDKWSSEWWNGFLKGALEVFAEVEDQL